MQVEISLQPWRAFKPDGVILFSDILTPLTGMGIPFDIEAGRGPVIHEPIRTMQVGIALIPPPRNFGTASPSMLHAKAVFDTQRHAVSM